ncbi:transcriptional regulator, GntR family [Agrilactobacillus composti DSM 18527 = JCM 14202]|nr:GntR family transcriptional regulator [Agrilactobacillus composti]GAF40476.1 transcriptional regulator, GntR family [Agrilactobacillus composti DSM 18527 = JCM 14202]
MENLQDQVYHRLFRAILELEYIPGQRINDKALTEELNVSRTPIREAIVRLKKDGLLVVVPQSGTYVSKIDLHAALDGRFVRENIEKIVVRESINNITAENLKEQHRILTDQSDAVRGANPKDFFYLDNQFHQNFYKYDDKSEVWRWLQNITIQLDRFRWLRLNNSDLRWDLLIKQHTEILDAISRKRHSQAEQLAGLHMNLMLDEEDSMLKAFPEYFTE